jgi:hypothetical protein
VGEMWANATRSSMNSFFSLFILMINYGVGKAAEGSSIQPWRAIHRMRESKRPREHPAY